MDQSGSKKPDFSIRRANSDDTEQVIRIWMEGAKGAHSGLVEVDSSAVEAHFSSQLEVSGDLFMTWIAETRGGEALGWQSLLPCRNSPLLRGTMAESSTYISEAARGRGVGRALMSKAIEHSQQSPLRYLIGYIAGENQAALDMCLQLGWQVVGTVPGSPRLAALKPWHILIYTVPNPESGVSKSLIAEAVFG